MSKISLMNYYERPSYSFVVESNVTFRSDEQNLCVIFEVEIKEF